MRRRKGKLSRKQHCLSERDKLKNHTQAHGRQRNSIQQMVAPGKRQKSANQPHGIEAKRNSQPKDGHDRRSLRDYSHSTPVIIGPTKGEAEVIGSPGGG